MPGRPTMLTELIATDLGEMTVADYIVACLELGQDFTSSAAAAGVGRSSLNQWKAKGAAALERLDRGETLDGNDAIYADFADAVKSARGRRTVRLLKGLTDAATQPQRVKKIVVKKELRDQDTGPPVMVVVEQTETIEERPGPWQILAWLLERGEPGKFGRRIEIEDVTEGRSSSEIARTLADELRAFQMGELARVELDADRAGVIEVSVVEGHPEQ